MKTSRPAPAAPARRLPAVLGGAPLFETDLYVTRPVVPAPERFGRLVAEPLRTHWLTNDGPLLVELERRLAMHLGVDACTTFCNGTTALLMALRALDLRGEVITTPFTFPATPHCIEWNGLRPVFADIDPETWCLDPAGVEARIGPETSAILPVHVFGSPCDVSAFEAIAARHGLRVVYDAAHCFGVRYRGEPLGRHGDCAALSFHATKVFHTAEGGAVLTRDADLRARLELLRNFGIVDENVVRGIGLNGKLSELHAAMGLSVLDVMDDEIARRGRLAALYRDGLGALPGIALQRFAEDTVENHFNLAIEIDPAAFGLDRDAVHRALLAERVVTRKYFHPLCSEYDAYRDTPSAEPARLPVAHRVASRILSLPLYGDLAPEAVHGIVDVLATLHAEAPAVRRALA
jgi:dTDP-4-amino-4,6-dideoxygalactose transaminase